MFENRLECEGGQIGELGGGFEAVKELEGIFVIWQLAGDFEDGRRGEGGEERVEIGVGEPGTRIGGLEEGKRIGDGGGLIGWRRRWWCEVGIGGEATESGDGDREGGFWGFQRF